MPMRLSDIFKFRLPRLADPRGARIQRPDGSIVGVPYVLDLNSTPRILLPNGVANASGQLTLNNPLPWLLPGEIPVYVPPNVVVGDAVGGWRTATFSANGVCQLVGNPATNAGAYSQISSLVTFRSVTVPGGAMGPNGALRLSLLYALSPSANGKVMQSFFSGGIFGANSTVASNFVSYGLISTLRNIGVENRQMAQNVAGDIGGNTGAMINLSIDTTADRLLTFSGSLTPAAAAGNDYLALIGSTVEILPGA